MAGDEHLIRVDDRASEWMLLMDIARVIPRERWLLVGGLMVHAHATSAGFDPPRHTTDLDLLVDIGAARIADVAGPLLAAGFEAPAPASTGAPFHRFARGHDVVDVMVPNTADGTFRFRRRGVLRSPGTHQALSRRDHFTVTAVHSGATVTVDAPDALGAIIVKAAAHRVDQRDRGRHLEDAVVLLAAASPKVFGQVLSPRDRQHLRPLLSSLADEFAPCWGVLDDAQREFAHDALERLMTAAAREH